MVYLDVSVIPSHWSARLVGDFITHKAIHPGYLNEKCAVIAVSHVNSVDASRLAYLGLWSLQHRGQDSSGIAAFDGVKLNYHKGSGLVGHVYDEQSLAKLPGPIAIGHNRYSTSGGNDTFLNQPFVNEGLNFAFAHNGNLPFTEKLKDYMVKNKIITNGQNDSGLMALALSNELKHGKSLEEAIKTCWPLFTGAFCCTGLYKDKLFAFRDGSGIRPLSLGKTKHGYVIASETVALNSIGAEFVRDARPGELIVITSNKLESFQIVKGKEQIDAFEFVYFARPDSQIAGQSVYEARYRSGQALAKVAPVKADVVVSVPDSSIPAATGYSQASGIPFAPGLIKNRYVGRTFIEPEKVRKSSVELKFNVIREVVNGKKIVLVDDSLVRGSTLSYVISQLRKHGAKEIHVRIASPPVKYPDFYGIDTPTIGELIAHDYDKGQIAKVIRADSLEYLPLQPFIKSIGLPESRLCLSCFNCDYPIKVPYKDIKQTKEPAMSTLFGDVEQEVV